jgi:acetyl-CoA/propionyl-CoA carboxylase, biotin carboxylase, biotin carboxyl carrier protein
MGQAAVGLGKALGYVNLGTVEMLADADDFYFLEVNARLQVEHTVTEEVFGLDLVATQLRIAAGEAIGFDQSDLTPRGHAIECRINAEDPTRGFAPTPGKLLRYTEPAGPGVRVDSGYEAGDQVPDAYDSLLAKIICHGEDREQARRRMLRALDEMEVTGVASTVPAHRLLLEQDDFVDGSYTTTTVEQGLALDSLTQVAQPEVPHAVLLVQGRPVTLWNPGMSSSATAAVAAEVSTGAIVAPMQGTILKLWSADGDAVEIGDPLIVLEAMKMETTITANRRGKVGLQVEAGESVGAGQLLAVIE